MLHNCVSFYKYVMRQKSNETGNAVHEPTMLLAPPSCGS